MHLTSLQLSNQRTSQNINTSSNQNHFRISNQFTCLLPAASSHASSKRSVSRLHATVATWERRKKYQQQLRLFKFNGRNARGDFTSEATTTVQRFAVMLGNAATGPVARSSWVGLISSCLTPGLACSTARSRFAACHHD